jgi:DNA-3-methyladenine glycosylase I
MSSADGLARCTWPGLANPQYTDYHDTEWGVPKTAERDLFEKMVLEGFQSGLSWLTILRKRSTFRTAFHDFDAEKIARYTDRDRARLMADTGIIRNRLKIDATIDNARAYLKLREKMTLAEFFWAFVDGQPVINAYAAHGDVPAETETSKRISKALKAEGFRFVGPTTMYAFMQASGLVNDHLIGCHRHAACSRLMASFVLPGGSHGKP